MAIIFQVRGTALDAYYARFAKSAGLVYGGSTVAPAVTALTSSGIFGNSYIAKRNNLGNQRGLIYPGFSNTWSGAPFTILLRIIPRWTGAPGTLMTLCTIGGYSGSGLAKIECSILTSGAFRLRMSDRNQGTLTLNDTSGTYTSYVSGTPVDIMMSWDGTTGANAVKWSVEGTEVGTVTAGQASVQAGALLRTGIQIGCGGVDSNHADWDLNEFVIWDSAESHTYSPRSDFYTPPSTGEGKAVESMVKTGQTYYDLDVFTSKTGTYDGSDRWTDPGESSVKTGTAYKANSTSNNKTGTYDGSDRWTDPGEANVRSGTAYKANSTSNNKTGSASIPTAANVKVGVATDATTGTYDGSDRWTDLDEADVREGVPYKANSVTENKTGTLAGSEDPGITNVKIGTEYVIEGEALTGLYEGTDRFTSLAEEDVRYGLEYLANNQERTGKLTYLPTDARSVCDQILRFIGAESLTDDEWATLTVTVNSTGLEVYQALYGVLDARGSTAAMMDRLACYFKAKGIDIVVETEREPGQPHILIGSDLESAPVAEGKSNVFIGGVIE